MTNITYKNCSKEEYYKIKNDFEYLLSLMTVDKLAENYTLDNFYKDDHLFYSMVYRDGKPYEASTVIYRDNFNNGCRVLNRLMVDPNERSINFRISDSILTMLKYQIDYTKDKFDFAFISREFNTHLFCKRFARDCNNFLDSKWMYEKEKFLVNWDKKRKVPKDSCWQWIAWTNFKNIPNLPLQSLSTFNFDNDL